MLKQFLKQLVGAQKKKSNTDTMEVALDERWYEKMREFGSFQAYNFFEGNNLYRNGQKNLFLHNEIKNPNLDYPLIDNKDLTELKTKLQNLLIEIDNVEDNDLVREAYKAKIREKGLEIRLVQITYRLSQTKIANEVQELSKEFRNVSEDLYGKPSKKIFEYAIAKLRSKAKKFAEKNNLTKASVIDLLNVLPDYQHNIMEATLNQSMIDKYFSKMLLPKEMQKDIEFDVREEYFDSEEIKEYFETFLNKLNLKDWNVIISNNVSSISIDHSNKTVIIPQKRKLHADKLRMLLVHEIGVHVFRRSNGEKSPLKLLGLGLANYELGEEGLAGVCEDIFKKAHEVSFGTLIGYVAIGLVYGLDGKERDFRDLYEILHKFYRFKLIKNIENESDIDLETVEKVALDKAWKRALRIFRGTNCAVPGVCFTKDIIYLKGRLCVWDAIKNNKKELSRLFDGKYDPCNPEHTKILDELGM